MNQNPPNEFYKPMDYSGYKPPQLGGTQNLNWQMRGTETGAGRDNLSIDNWSGDSGREGMASQADNFSPDALDGKTPDAAGGWMKAGNFGLGVAKVGLGIYNALESSKMNKFMRGYYGDQMDLQTADFANAAKSTNEALAARQGRILSARGEGAGGSEQNQAGVDTYMKTWGVEETV
jgi:hypothetical protein